MRPRVRNDVGPLAYLALMAQSRNDRQRTRAMRKARNLATVNDLKANPCTDCGGSFPVVCMDFDHVRGEKHADISRMLLTDYPLERILAEIELCELVCANCHRIRSWRRWKRSTAELPEPVPTIARDRCARGHLYVEANLYLHGIKRKRYCRACFLARQAAYRARRRGEDFDRTQEADRIYAELVAEA